MIADHDEIENALPAYLMGTAEPEEAERVRTHLEGCSRCQRAARRMRRALDAFPLGAGEAPPPGRLRERILAAASESPQASGSQPKRGRVVRLPLPKIRLWPLQTSSFGAAVAAVAIVAFALGGGLGLGLGRALTPSPSRPATAIAQYSLNGSGAMTGAQGHVYELRQQGLTLVQFTGLPQPGPGKVFELWFISKDGHPDPAAVFAPDSGGSHVVVLARGLSGLKALAVTEEVGPTGTPAPTQQPQLAGAVG